MVVSKYISIALRHESDANYERMRKEPSHSSIAHSYKTAADYREKAGDFGKAIKDYEEALRYAHSDPMKKEISTKLKELRLESAKVLGRLHAIRGKLEDRIFVFISAIVILSASLFFSLFSLTGNSIAILNNEDFSWIGLCFFLCGLVFAFFYFKKNKNKKNNKK